MDIYYIDLISVTHRSWLRRVPAGVKLVIVLAIIGYLLTVESVPVTAGIFAVMLLLALSARVPMSLYLALTFYPIVLLIVLYLSLGELTLASALLFGIRVLAITSTVVLLILTTSYPRIFGALSRVLPGFLVAALFFTYRSIFIITESISNVRMALHLRGGFRWQQPFRSLHNLGLALGHVLIHSIDTSERMADSLTVRGFSNRIYYLGERP
ncbi:MAG: energy-coupling factor transporter transmembrane component T family protein [Armatimonadota bacterium]